jgi:hypothetical protein
VFIYGLLSSALSTPDQTRLVAPAGPSGESARFASSRIRLRSGTALDRQSFRKLLIVSADAGQSRQESRSRRCLVVSLVSPAGLHGGKGPGWAQRKNVCDAAAAIQFPTRVALPSTRRRRPAILPQVWQAGRPPLPPHGHERSDDDAGSNRTPILAPACPRSAAQRLVQHPASSSG